MLRKYTKPEIKIVIFETEDIITASGTGLKNKIDNFNNVVSLGEMNVSNILND